MTCAFNFDVMSEPKDQLSLTLADSKYDLTRLGGCIRLSPKERVTNMYTSTYFFLAIFPQLKFCQLRASFASSVKTRQSINREGCFTPKDTINASLKTLITIHHDSMCFKCLEVICPCSFERSYIKTHNQDYIETHCVCLLL